MKVALAYSGGLDTSVLVHWFAKEKNAEVVTYCADIGQEEELRGLKKKALRTGASKIYIDDLQEEFARDFIFPMMQAGAIYEGQYFLGTSIARPLIAKRMVEIAKLEKADAIAQATSQPDAYAGQPKGTRAVQLLDAQVPSYTLDVFGRCPRTDNCADPTQFGGGLSSTLHLLNSPVLNAKLGSAISKLLKKHPQPGTALDELFLRTLSRFPSEKERGFCLKTIEESRKTKEAWQDIMWALLNSREFGFNH